MPLNPRLPVALPLLLGATLLVQGCQTLHQAGQSINQAGSAVVSVFHKDQPPRRRRR